MTAETGVDVASTYRAMNVVLAEPIPVLDPDGGLRRFKTSRAILHDTLNQSGGEENLAGSLLCQTWLDLPADEAAWRDVQAFPQTTTGDHSTDATLLIFGSLGLNEGVAETFATNLEDRQQLDRLNAIDPYTAASSVLRAWQQPNAMPGAGVIVAELLARRLTPDLLQRVIEQYQNVTQRQADFITAEQMRLNLPYIRQRLSRSQQLDDSLRQVVALGEDANKSEKIDGYTLDELQQRAEYALRYNEAAQDYVEIDHTSLLRLTTSGGLIEQIDAFDHDVALTYGLRLRTRFLRQHNLGELGVYQAGEKQDRIIGTVMASIGLGEGAQLSLGLRLAVGDEIQRRLETAISPDNEELQDLKFLAERLEIPHLVDHLTARETNRDMRYPKG